MVQQQARSACEEEQRRVNGLFDNRMCCMFHLVYKYGSQDYNHIYIALINLASTFKARESGRTSPKHLVLSKIL